MLSNIHTNLAYLWMEFKWFSVTSTISCPVLQLMIWYLNPVVIRSYSCESQCVCV